MKEIVEKRFKINRIVYYNNEKKWGVLGTTPVDDLGDHKLDLMNDFSNVTLAGNFTGAYEGAEIIIDGDIIENPKYGKQIQIRNYKIIADTKTKEGVINFLSKSQIAGISTQNANKIYAKYGKDSINVVLEAPEKLITINGIGGKTIEKIAASVHKYKENEKFYEYMAELGISYVLGERILNEFGRDALERVQTDPFSLLEISSTITFKQVDEIFIKQGGDPNNKKRLDLCLLYLLRRLAILEGSTGVVSKYLRKKFYDTLGIYSESGIYENVVRRLEKRNKLITTQGALSGIFSGEIYFKEYIDLERNIAGSLLSLEKYGATTQKVLDSVIEEEIKDFPFTLNAQQIEAVNKCLEHNVAVLTGAAGCITGDAEVHVSVKSKTRENYSYGFKFTLKEFFNLYEHKKLPNVMQSSSFKNDYDLSQFYVSSYFDDIPENFGYIDDNKVKRVVYSGKKEVWKLTLDRDGGTIEATPDHEFFVNNKGWVQLKDLTKYDAVLAGYDPPEGDIWPYYVEKVEKIGIKDTYDIMCAKDPHNFVANGMVVHNSGKSSITKAIYQIYRRSGFNVELLSPTAKACRRLEECTGGQAKTIHRFLKMGRDGRIPEVEKFPQDTVIIIDEASMLDIILFSNLLAGMSKTTRIVLVGDNNQLPSVQAGNVLGDIIASDKLHVSLLTDIMRQKENSNIINYCSMINEGKVMDPCDHEDFHYEEFGTAQELKDVFFPKYMEEVENFGLNEVQVIAPYKKGEIGMDNLNLMLQSKYQTKHLGPELLAPYKEGDRVRHTVNNYNKEVFNGETGVVIGLEDEELVVDYGSKIINYKEAELEELTLSYASTVHSSQGSEYKVVFVILDDTSANDFLHIRRLLYTAVSRGKKRVYIYTKPYLVDKCIMNGSYRPRITRLKQYLRGKREEDEV